MKRTKVGGKEKMSRIRDDYDNSRWRKIEDWIKGEKDPMDDAMEIRRPLDDGPDTDVQITEESLERTTQRLFKFVNRAYSLFSVCFCILLVTIMIWYITFMPTFGDGNNPVNNEVSQRYIEKGLEETGATNFVTGMILDYRAFDTFGESCVLFISTICVQILLRHEKLYGVRPGWWLPMWSGSQFDSNFPVYFPLPDYMGDFEKFKNECERNGLTILPHVNVVQWAVFNFTPESQKRYQAEWDGSNYPNWIYANIRQIITNIGRSFERELPTVVGLSSPSDHHGIYLDCFAQGFAKDNNPASPYCEEANCYQLGKLHLARNVRKIIAGPLMTEGRMEYLLPYTDLTTGANGGSPNQLPLWEMVYGDCVVNNTFNSHWSPYFRKMWMMQGGLISSYWPKWGEDKGEDLDIYTETTCQRVIRHVEGTLMRRHDRPQGIAVSQWDNGVVFWNPPAAQADSARYRPWGPAAKKHDASPENLTFATALGEFAIESIARDGIWAWTPDGDFIADHVRKVSRNGETVFSCDSDDLVVIRGMGRWVIRNCSDKPVKVTIYSKCLKEATLPQGKWVRQQREETPHCIDGTVTLEIPANELFVSGIPLYSEK